MFSDDDDDDDDGDDDDDDGGDDDDAADSADEPLCFTLKLNKRNLVVWQENTTQQRLFVRFGAKKRKGNRIHWNFLKLPSGFPNKAKPRKPLRGASWRPLPPEWCHLPAYKPLISINPNFQGDIPAEFVRS